ncbi:MAG TPA: hypothetical protein ENI07_15650 [Desulfobacterales bacterium]|nr:hypothetical protein [Desulfobacterales bacterium]
MAQTKEGAIKCAANKIGVSVKEYSQRVKNGERWCWKCRAWKLKEVFPSNSGPANAISGKCLECNRVKVKISRKGIPSPLRGITMSEEAKEKMSTAHKGESNHRWKGGISYRKKPRDPLKTKAKRAVNHAVEAGRLANPKTLPCFDCGNPAYEYHHHRGYEKANWLEIQALCQKCHTNRRYEGRYEAK